MRIIFLEGIKSEMKSFIEYLNEAMKKPNIFQGLVSPRARKAREVYDKRHSDVRKSEVKWRKAEADLKKTFRQHTTEAVTTKHPVERGNKSGIGKVSRVPPTLPTLVKASELKKPLQKTHEARDTIYHHPHEDGKRHISVRFTSRGPKDKPHDSEEMETGVHDSKKDFKRWHSTPVIGDVGVAQPAVLRKRGHTKAHHQMKHESKKHSILHHHLSNTKANTVTSTTYIELTTILAT